MHNSGWQQKRGLSDAQQKQNRSTAEDQQMHSRSKAETNNAIDRVVSI